MASRSRAYRTPSSKGRRLKRQQCPERSCKRDFIRKSDLERHRKCVHHCIPALGDSRIYKCSICDKVRKRLDHFRKHVRHSHPERDLKSLIAESTILPVESDIVEASPSVGRTQDTLNHTTPSTDTHRLDNAMEDSDIWIPKTEVAEHESAPYNVGRQGHAEDAYFEGSPHPAVDSQHDSTSTEALFQVPINTLNLLRRAQIKHINGAYRKVLQEGDTSSQSIEHSDCDVPVYTVPVTGTGGGSGGFANSWPGDGQPETSNSSEKGKGPMREGGRDQDEDRQRGFGGKLDKGPVEVQDELAVRLPCVFCLFSERDNPTRDCATRKRYISNLWPHHYRHRLFTCWKCFEPFGNRATLEQHRRETCIALCLTSGCPNHASASCTYGPCNHTSYNTQVTIWRMLYRRAHGLSLADWVPDPTVEAQIVPQNLPHNHPMARYSLTNIGTWVPDQEHAVVRRAAPSSASQEGQHSPLRSLLINLWGRVNRSNPTWSPFTDRLYRTRIRPPQHQTYLQELPQDNDESAMLEVLASEFAMIIDTPRVRTLEQWDEVTQMTRGLLGNLVTVPNACPWRTLQLAASIVPQPGPSQRRPPQATVALDPMLAQWQQDPLPLATGPTSFPPGMYTNEESIPQASLQAYGHNFLAVPGQSRTYYTRSEPAGRRHSLASPTSPSERPFFSPAPSIDFSNSFQHISSATGSYFNATQMNSNLDGAEDWIEQSGNLNEPN